MTLADIARQIQADLGPRNAPVALSEDIRGRLTEVVGSMRERQYRSAGERPQVPVVKTAHAGILHGSA